MGVGVFYCAGRQRVKWNATDISIGERLRRQSIDPLVTEDHLS